MSSLLIAEWEDGLLLIREHWIHFGGLVELSTDMMCTWLSLLCVLLVVHTNYESEQSGGE